MNVGVKIYYAISALIDLFLAVLFFIMAFPIERDFFIDVIFALCFLYMFAISVYAFIKNVILFSVVFWKGGIIFLEFGLFAASEYILSGGKYFSNIIIALVFCLIGIFAMLIAIKVMNKNFKKELEEEIEKTVKESKKEYTYTLAEGQPKVKKIWQYKFHAKPFLTEAQRTKKNIILISSIVGFVAGIMIPVIMMITFDMDNIYESVAGNIFFMISIFSIFVFAMTLGSYKPHRTSNLAFVLCEDGSVFVIDYYDRRIAKEFGYANRLPMVRTGLYAMYFGADADECFSYIRNNDIDKKIAENCATYGDQIIAVPQLCKCNYFTDMTFVVWHEGKPLEIKTWYNLYDNCYEGYDEMIEYLDTHFDHKFDEEYVKKTNTIKALLLTGAIIGLIGIIVWLIGPIVDENLPIVIGMILSLVGLSMSAICLERFKRRRKVL